MSTIIRAWHFLPEDRRLRYGDSRKVRTGCWHRVQFPYTNEDASSYDYKKVYQRPTLCEAGMHASVRALDALRYAPGPLVGLCEIEGRIQHGDDKIVGEARRYIAIADATRVLREFACDVAEKALFDHAPDSDDPLIQTADEAHRALIVATRALIAEELAHADLGAARAAAWAAARDAARAAARDAAWDAARAAARDAAWDAAWAAAWAAAWDAARAAARAAAWDEYNTMLETRLHVLLGTTP